METADTTPHAHPPHTRTAAETTGHRPPQLALELLVHGVGGTTPQAMLGEPRTTLITGDDTAACYRRSEDADAEERPEDYRDTPVREAYCWSNLTSGNGARALWLVLLPFMVANLAHWMRPAGPPGHPAQRVYDVLVRALALSLTVLLAAAACEVALDLTAWQCAGTASCVAGKSWMGFVSPAQGGWWSLPGRRLVLATALPLLVIALLTWLSHRTWSAYESASPPPRRPGTSRNTPPDERTTLSLDGFWYGRRVVARLRTAHTTAGVLTVAAAVLCAVRTTDARSGAAAALTATGDALAVLLALLAAATLVVVARTARSEAAPDDTRDRAVVRALPHAALGAFALTAVYAAWQRPMAPTSGPLPGAAAFGALTVLQGVLVLALVLTARVLHRTARDDARAALNGMGGPAVALLACAVGGVLSGGAAQRFADWIDGDATPGDIGAPMAGPPVLLSWQASVIPVLLLVVIAVALLAALRVRAVSRRVAADVPGLYDARAKPDAWLTGKIAGTIARAGLTDSAPVLVAATAAVTLLLGAGAVLGAWYTDLAPGPATVGAPPAVHAAAETASALGSWLMGAGVVLLLATGRRAYRDRSARRTIGILWDVGTFWPRAAHPFAPPCYAERAVPDLTWRMATWTERHDGRLVISGHSQGSVLAAAAVWQLDLVTRSRVALLTYGSPLERLYGRWFPAFFGPPFLTGLHREMDDWRNLWRFTDPIGGPIRLTGEEGKRVDEGPLRDPLTLGRTLQHPLPAQILGHGDYQADPVFDRVRGELLARLATALPGQRATPSGPGTPDLPDAPEKGNSPKDQGSSGRSSG
ncbi:hypothetical protein ACGH2B_25715 [Streptomyces sp. BBFR2]|uniref:hypothetical protein n=1 Tax=Streptomyces sp. BBFR2 TaxID=3372854 RepID=UPI0037D9B5A4